MSNLELPSKTIEGQARSIRQVLDKAKYAIDFYQREYVWQERQVRELIDDLTGKFLNFYDPSHARHQVEGYGHYFLGSIVISHKRSQRFIIDGQQRLTTLTLLLIHLHHLQQNRDDRVDVQNLIFSEKFGRKSFNLDVPDRKEIMQSLLDGDSITPTGKSESAHNIRVQYDNIQNHHPEEVTGPTVPYFVDWLMENVRLIEIEAYSDEDAYTIFETMNDRGLSLSLPDMLKGYFLANIHHEDDQQTVNTDWKNRMQSFKEQGKEEEVDFFKNWFRARYAETVRSRTKGAENKDYERIGTEFHRWVRDDKQHLGLTDSDSFVRFIKRDLCFYADLTLKINKAARTLTSGWESIRYNEDRGFTLQTQALLAPLTPDDSPEVVQRKVSLVADFLDIWLARRVWNFRTIGYSSIMYTVFSFTRNMRGRDVASLAEYLQDQLEDQPQRFAQQPGFRLHGQNYRQVRHMLARLTHWLQIQCDLPSNFEDLVSQGRARPFEIEHIWANQFDRFSDWFPYPSDFAIERNRLGGLVLLQRGLNQSLGDKPYHDKRDAYLSHSENLLARSLHPLAYDNNPSFKTLLERTGLPFRPYDVFGPEEQSERQELYIRLAESVWNPSRLDLDGEKPPIHEPIGDMGASNPFSYQLAESQKARLTFWQQLLTHANKRSDLHRNISPSQHHWVAAHRHGQSWNYVILQTEARVELYFDTPIDGDSKVLFDQLYQRKTEIEAAFGNSLRWQRLDNKQACRISYMISGGLDDEHTWNSTIEQSVQSMQKLYAAISPHLICANEELKNTDALQKT